MRRYLSIPLVSTSYTTTDLRHQHRRPPSDRYCCRSSTQIQPLPSTPVPSSDERTNDPPLSLEPITIIFDPNDSISAPPPFVIAATPPRYTVPASTSPHPPTRSCACNPSRFISHNMHLPSPIISDIPNPPTSPSPPSFPLLVAESAFSPSRFALYK